MTSALIGYSVLFYISASYVSVLYITARDAEQYKRKRDDPRVIRSRMKRISLLTIFNIFFIPLLQTKFNKSNYINNLLNLGIIPGRQLNGQWNNTLYFKNFFESLILICQLYIGPIIDTILYYVVSNCSSLISDINDLYNNIWSVRNNIFAPITEEIFYTSMLLTTYMTFFDDGDLTFKKLLIEPPLFFGIAHIHHSYEIYLLGTQTIISIIISTTFQILYTSLFGILTNYIFLITHGNLLSCIILHSICNIIGFPNGSELISYLTIIKPSNSNIMKRLLQIWQKVYIGLLVIGIILFAKGLDNFTQI
ncbi:similar to Saccharomyces cerevisiae YMR274C RCE1 Type II CAAX prenyl protease involved in the proteolysis and maturation of Ras and the a-factor mating pheromone [Maudiozyma saulgeensis]|uniref:intramembrane prenyl-peptidase Rce1 n=1 Tax=Maudiozyma saulgeensis TaxID=1789683 RepID=A0A1X7R9Z4_9SACH|nr:similar to Saccharomyces cerevisiae YMR274C RCE1 Type II CAAX prenyl protease involved in the proteolysis and maturation of Ras and the a-factor mating pheromone [Kazachstania saulgeensis]